MKQGLSTIDEVIKRGAILRMEPTTVGTTIVIFVNGTQAEVTKEDGDKLSAA